MENSSEMLKIALVGGSPSVSPASLSKLASDCVGEISLHPERDPSQIVAEKARTSGMNGKQAARLSEETNKKLIRPILDSNNKARKNTRVDKVKVKEILEGENKAPESRYKVGPSGSLVDSGLNSTMEFGKKPPKDSEMTKRAGIRKLAGMNRGETSDYFEEPVSYTTHSFVNEHGLNEMSKEANVHKAYASDEYDDSPYNELVRTESYSELGLQQMQAKLAVLKREHENLCFGFTKMASQICLTGGSWEDVVDATLQLKRDKEACGLLKSAASYLGKRDIIEESDEWVEAFDVYAEGFNHMSKTSGIPMPNSNSRISRNTNGRMRVIDGDHTIVKKLRAIKCNERKQREASVGIKRLHRFRRDSSMLIKRMVD